MENVYLRKHLTMGDAAGWIYDDLAEFFAGLAPEKVLAFQPSGKLQDRMSSLLDKKREAELSPKEKEELDHLFNLERIIRLAKAHAAALLSYGKIHS